MDRRVTLVAVAALALIVAACGGRSASEGGDCDGGVWCSHNSSVDGGTDGGTPKNDRVVMIGDSIFAMSGEIKKQLEELSGETYRSYYIVGAEVTRGMVQSIPSQYGEAKADGSIRTVIMDGSGNVVMISGPTTCSGTTVSSACKSMLQTEVYDVLDKLFGQMRTDGVQNIIYLSYYHTSDATTTAVIDYGAEKMSALCAKNGVFYIDPRSAFEGREAELILQDGLHPTAEGSTMLADMIWDVMVQNDIEQH